MFKFAVVLVVFLVICGAESVKFEDCGSKLGKIVSLQVSDCEGDECDLVKGKTYSVTLVFDSTAPTKTVTTQIEGQILDVWVPFPYEPANSCTDDKSGLTCPLTSGTQYTYKAALPVLESYPTIKLPVKWELVGDGEVDIICFEIGVQIVPDKSVNGYQML